MCQLLTSNSEKLKTCFDSIESPQTVTRKFFKTLKSTFYESFKKIRIKKSNSFPFYLLNKNDKNLQLKSELEHVMNNTTCEIERAKVKHKIEQVEKDILEHISEVNANTVKEHMACIDTLDCKFNQLGMWNLKKKLCPRPNEPPTAKKDELGNLITAPSTLRNLYLRTYKNRLEHRKMEEKYKVIRDLKNELWELRLEGLKSKISVPWTIEDLEKVTKSLKNNQAHYYIVKYGFFISKNSFSVACY